MKDNWDIYAAYVKIHIWCITTC